MLDMKKLWTAMYGPMYTRVVRFGRLRLILMGTLKKGGPLVKKMPENWETSFAHLYPNGEIKQFGRVIGRREDLKLVARSCKE